MKFLLGLFLILLIIFQTGMTLLNFSLPYSSSAPIKVGLVYSMTGFRSQREKAVKEATLLAIQEINETGGLLGRKIEPILGDSQSNWESTRQVIEDLILNKKVEVIFGGWTPGTRYTTKELFEKHNHLLISPFQYEGTVISPNILNVGVSANQQITPAVYYALKHFGRRFFLIGSNYVFPHIINIMIKDHIKALGGEIAGEIYLPLNNIEQLDQAIKVIVESKPDGIFSSIIGEDNYLFFKQLREAGIHAEQTPILSFNLNETLLQEMDIQDTLGIYTSSNYFQSISSEDNQEFIKRFKAYSNLKAIDNAAEAGYVGVYLWAEAVKEAKSTIISELNYALQDMRISAPEGIVTLDMLGRHAWKFARIGKVQSNREFDIVWQSANPIRPIPFQVFRSKLEWEELTEEIYHTLSKTSTSLFQD